MIKIAILEDERTQAQLIEQALIGGEGLGVWGDEVECEVFDSGLALLNQLKKTNPYDCVILDRHLPDMSGDVVLQWLRQYAHKYTPVVMLTSMRGEDNVVQSLEAGADEYMTKPLAPKELLFRVQRLIGREKSVSDSVDEQIVASSFAVKNYVFNAFDLSVVFDDQMVGLTEREFRIAVLLFKSLGLNISRQILIEAGWGSDQGTHNRKLDTHMHNIRDKLELTIEKGWQLRSIYGFGYRLSSNIQ